jgi:imidazole glycerol-phosphate synthase subunit HisH
VIGIIEYGAGNIRSVSNALKRLGVGHFVSNDKTELDKADKLVFPGVGEAKSAMETLIGSGLTEWLREIKVPFLGICLGMELLFDHTTERETNCLGVISGSVEKFQNEKINLKVPHLGWNEVNKNQNNPLFDGIKSGEHFYFDHSYYAPIIPETIGVTDYGIEFTSVLKSRNYHGVQFHPEKSGKAGLHLLKNFVELC